MYFFDPKNPNFKQELQTLSSVKETFPEKKLKLYPIPLNPLDSNQFSYNQKSDFYTISSLNWKYRIKPTFWFVENGKLVKLTEGTISKNELKELTLEFIGAQRRILEKVILKQGLWREIISPEKAYTKAFYLKEVQELFSRTLAQGSEPLSEVELCWDQRDSSIFWRITFTDRVCDCSGEEVNAFNYARMILNPLDLKVLELDLWEDIPENEFEKVSIR